MYSVRCAVLGEHGWLEVAQSFKDGGQQVIGWLSGQRRRIDPFRNMDRARTLPSGQPSGKIAPADLICRFIGPKGSAKRASSFCYGIFAPQDTGIGSRRVCHFPHRNDIYGARWLEGLV